MKTLFWDCWIKDPTFGHLILLRIFLWREGLTVKQQETTQLHVGVCVCGKRSLFFFYFHHYLGKWSNLTNIFQMGWNHQLETDPKQKVALLGNGKDVSKFPCINWDKWKKHTVILFNKRIEGKKDRSWMMIWRFDIYGIIILLYSELWIYVQTTLTRNM